MLARTPEAIEKTLADDYFPLVLRLVFRHVRIAATDPITFVMSVRLSTAISAAPTNFRELHIRDFNFIVACDINRPWNTLRVKRYQASARSCICIISAAPTKPISVKFEMETVTKISREIPHLVTIGQKFRALCLNALRMFYCCRWRHKSAFFEWNGTRLSGEPRRYKHYAQCLSSLP
jgi:hypothetical protein